jgi:hypothetical protein
MSWGFVGLLVLFVMLYGVMAMNLATMRSSDAAGNGMAAAFAAVSGFGAWIVLAVLLGMAEDGMSFMRPFFLFMALAVASVASLVDAALGRRRYIALILPLAFLAIAIWLRSA